MHPSNYLRLNFLLSKKLYISIRHAFVEPYDKTKRMWDKKVNILATSTLYFGNFDIILGPFPISQPQNTPHALCST